MYIPTSLVRSTTFQRYSQQFIPRVFHAGSIKAKATSLVKSSLGTRVIDTQASQVDIRVVEEPAEA